MKTMLKSQKNEIFKTLVSSGVDESLIGKITWLDNAKKYKSDSSSDDGNGVALTVQQDSNIFFFYFNGSANAWIYRGFPIGIGNNEVARWSFVSWTDLLKDLSNWGSKISAELEAPDLWADLSNIKSAYSLDNEEFKDNEAITAKEAHAIKSKLTILENKIIENYGKSDETIKVIKEKFDYLIGCVDRQDKKDWSYTLIGVLSSLAIAIGVSAANADKFWLLVKSVLGSPMGLLLGN
jgi:hypothetical protein